MLAVPIINKTGLQEKLTPGDLLAGGESVLNGPLTTAGAGTWTGPLIANGIIYRTGPVGAYTDTTATAAQIIAALAGNGPAVDVLKGMTFRLLFINTVAQAMTYAGGAGVVTGLGTLDCAASLMREYLITILNADNAVVAQTNTTNANAVLTFVLPPGQVALPVNPSFNITVGMTVAGTGITTGTTVIGVTQGQGGIVGVTLSANATATSAVGGVSLTFGPTVRIDSLGTKGL